MSFERTRNSAALSSSKLKARRSIPALEPAESDVLITRESQPVAPSRSNISLKPTRFSACLLSSTARARSLARALERLKLRHQGRDACLMPQQGAV